MKNLLLFFACCFSIALYGQERSTFLKFDNPEVDKGYSNFVEVDFGSYKMLLISGQVPINEKGELIGKNDMEKQTEQVFKNIKKLIEKAGGNINDLVKTDIYLTDINQIQKFRDARDKFINFENPPVSTLMEVKSLFREDVLVEIGATAIIPNSVE